MAFDAHKNLAISAVATAPSPASSGTSLVVTAGHGTRFPAVSFNATVWPAASQPSPANAEIVRVTNIATDTFTITREQEGTSARAVIVGDQIAETITAKALTDIEAAIPAATAGTFALTIESNHQRFTITDAAVTSSSKIIGSIIRPTVAEVDDTGWSYGANVVKRATGSFDIGVDAYMWGEDATPDVAASFRSTLVLYDETGGSSGTGVEFGRVSGRERIAEQITFAGGAVVAVELPVHISSSPTDDVVVEVQTDSAGAPSETVVATAVTFPIRTGSSAIFNRFVFSPSVELAAATYWLVLKRTGSLNDTDYYNVTTRRGGGTHSFYQGGWSAAGSLDLQYRLYVDQRVGTDPETVTYEYAVFA